MVRGRMKNDTGTYKDYYEAVYKDFFQMREKYPFSKILTPPTSERKEIQLDVVAVSEEMINDTCGKVDDFTGLYSKRIRIEVPFNYREVGCRVFGGEWINKNQIPEKDWHFNGIDAFGNLLLCVGVPASFKEMNNVILECVKTVDNMLDAYKLYQQGKTARVELNAYSHGKRGEKEYEKEQKDKIKVRKLSNRRKQYRK